MPDAKLDEDLIDGLKQAKKAPRHFAMIIKGIAPVKLMIKKKKFRDGELSKAKTEAKGNDWVVGILEASGTDFAFQITGDAEPKVTALKVKDWIGTQTGMTVIPRWSLVKELPKLDDDAEGEGCESQSQETTPTDTPTSDTTQQTTEPTPEVDPRAKQIADALKALAPKIQEAIGRNPGGKDELLSAVGRVKTPYAAGNYEEAQAAIAPLVQLIKDAMQAGDTTIDPVAMQDDVELSDLLVEEEEAEEELDDGADVTAKNGELPVPPPIPDVKDLPPPPPVTQSPVISGRAAWEEARQMVAENLAELQKHLAGIDDPDIQKIVKHGFSGITGRLQTGLRVALMEFDNSAGETRTKARAKASEIVEQFQEFVTTDPLLKLCDENVFNVPVNGRKILGDALQQLAASLKA